jgi:hypothetical protein
MNQVNYDYEMLRWFDFDHLPPHLRDVSQHFQTLAIWMMQNLPSTREREYALRKLLEAKDCAVRARVGDKSP